MARSPWSSALGSTPGYVPRPATKTVVNPAFTAIPTLPSVPAIDDARAPNAATRTWLLNQLGPLAQQNDAALTNIRSGAQLQLAGYGGWRFNSDDPTTAEREDLQLAFDPSSGPGEREKKAFRGERDQANARGLLYSSFANQNIASAMQRLSLEAQQIANQYAASLNQQHGNYATQVSNVIGQWTTLYGQDAAWLADNPPAPPPDPPPPPELPPSPGVPGAPGQPVMPSGLPPHIAQNFRPLYPNAQGNLVTNYTKGDLSPHMLSMLSTAYPGYKVVIAGNGRVVLKKK